MVDQDNKNNNNKMNKNNNNNNENMQGKKRMIRCKKGERTVGVLIAEEKMK